MDKLDVVARKDSDKAERKSDSKDADSADPSPAAGSPAHERDLPSCR
jgi:hypothetical protein